MLPTSLPATSAVHHTNEPDRFAAALLGGAFEFRAIADSPFSATLRLLRLGDLVVQLAQVGPHRSRSALSPGLSMLLVPLRVGRALPRVNGRPVDTTGMVFVPGGHEFSCHAPAPLEWAAVGLLPRLLDEWAEEGLAPLSRSGGPDIVAPPARTLQALAGALAFAARLADELPELLLSKVCATGLAMSLSETLSDCIAAAGGARPRPRACRDAWRILRNADAYLASRLDQPIYTGELCNALGVSARRLHYAFAATVGLSPHAYLKARRLALARRALLRPDAIGPHRVKTVAMMHGFMHFGHFAQDYRKMFGESPSATFASARR